MAQITDPKDLLLLGLYAEFNKPQGDYRLVTAQLLNMEPETWLWSLMCLKTEGLVEGVKWIPPHTTSAGRVLALHADQLHLTPEGIERARTLAEVDGHNRQLALRKLLNIFLTVGASTAAELIREAI